MLFVESTMPLTVAVGTQHAQLANRGACIVHGATVTLTAGGPAFVVMAHAPKAPRL